MVKKKGRGKNKITQPRIEINIRAMLGKHNTTQ